MNEEIKADTHTYIHTNRIMTICPRLYPMGRGWEKILSYQTVQSDVYSPSTFAIYLSEEKFVMFYVPVSYVIKVK